MKMLLIFTFSQIIAGSDAVTTVTGYRGRSVQIKCHYESGYEDYNKYLCRGDCWLGNKDVPVQSGPPAEDTRFSLYDDTTAKIFTITITDLRAEDANTYWCGIQRFVPFRDIYTKLQLLVEMDDPAISTVSQSTHTTQSASTLTVRPPVHANTTPQALGVATYPLISTCAVVLAVGVFIAIYRRNRSGSVTVMQPSTETNEDNESDRYVLPPQAREMQNIPESIYQNTDRTTNQSDSLYQSLTFTINQSDSVYQTLPFKNNQPESFYQCPTSITKQ
ncbi:CMRF35-like molecule 3 [Silurus meridionalis]|uniref:CMRF35-like molecule 3 n=1 Tax=Silurus meridionalis TaxID=175797 RepID=UPI001EEAB569|nr:CMRF35-like molecule 3 [Silurus meridionalis]